MFKLTVVALIAYAVLLGWRWVRKPELMPIHHVKLIATYQHIDQKTLVNIVNGYVAHAGLLSVDVGNLKGAMMQQPWIKQVVIKRIWPDQLEINITEQQPVAVWNKTQLMNSASELFAPPAKTFPLGLPQLQGPDNEEANVLQHWQQYNEWFMPLQLTVSEMQLNSRGSWQLILSNGIKVVLGRTDIDARLKRLIAAYPKVLAPKATDIANIDLRYTDGFSVQWHNKMPTHTQSQPAV